MNQLICLGTLNNNKLHCFPNLQRCFKVYVNQRICELQLDSCFVGNSVGVYMSSIQRDERSCCVQKMADRFSRFNEERDFQVMLIKYLATKYNVV
jgi:hypothetical protein